MFEVIQLYFSRKGAKLQDCRRNIMPQGNKENLRKDISLNANFSRILEGEVKDHEIEENLCRKKIITGFLKIWWEFLLLW